MTPTEPLPLHHSWPLWNMAQRFDLGHLHENEDWAAGERVAGHWACDLRNGRLHWSPEVFRLFGFECGGLAPERPATLACYAEPSRAAMERLRAYAIRHVRGFTLDIEVVPVRGDRRWLRLVAAPECDDERRVVRLHGWKADVSHLYGGRRA